MPQNNEKLLEKSNQSLKRWASMPMKSYISGQKRPKIDDGL
jgi:hypothetical protein